MPAVAPTQNFGIRFLLCRIRGCHVLINNVCTPDHPYRDVLELWVSSDNCATWEKKLPLARSFPGPLQPHRPARHSLSGNLPAQHRLQQRPGVLGIRGETGDERHLRADIRGRRNRLSGDSAGTAESQCGDSGDPMAFSHDFLSCFP